MKDPKIKLRRIFRYLFIFFLIFAASNILLYNKVDNYDISILCLLITSCMLFIDIYYPIVLF